MKKLFAENLKKPYNTINTALQKIAIDNGATTLAEVAKYNIDTEGYNNFAKLIDLDWLMDEFDKTLHIAKKDVADYTRYTLNKQQVNISDLIITNNIKSFQLNDGTIVNMGYIRGYGRSEYVVLIIDTNGEQDPNILGRDLFAFVILPKKSKLAPLYGREFLLYDAEGASPENRSAAIEEAKNNSEEVYNACNEGSEYSIFCAARLIEQDNWKMKY